MEDKVNDLRYGYIMVDEFCANFSGQDLVTLLKSKEFPFRRRSELCEYLGISESTLSGWIKESRIPFTAKKTIALEILRNYYVSKIESLENATKDKDRFFIVKENDKYKVCRYIEEVDKTPVWEVIAGDIPKLRDARLLSLPDKMLGALETISSESLDHIQDLVSDQIYLNDIQHQQDEIANFKKFVNEPEKYFESSKQ